MLSKFIKPIFTFTQKESEGIFILSIMIFGLWLVPYGYQYYLKVALPPPDIASIDSLFIHYPPEHILLKNEEPIKHFDKKTIIVSTKDSFKFKTKAKFIPSKFDINKADTNDLVPLKGIGTKTALRILAYRDALGGFVHVRQYKEIWGLQEYARNELEKYAFIDPAFHPRILNTQDVKNDSLVKHPYLRNKYGYTLLNYIRAHGKISNKETLIKACMMPDTLYQKVEPYIKLDQ